MKYILNIILVLAILLLGYMLVNSIKEPIAFEAAKSMRKGRVEVKLKNIRRAQEVFRMITGNFAPTFDSLSVVLNNDSIPTIKLLEDPDDPTNQDKFQTLITYSSAKDSLAAMGISNIDSLRYVPFTDGMTFKINADTMTYQQTLVSVVEVGTQWKNFMGKFASRKYSRYDSRYDPDAMLKFGNMNKPNLSGNWER